MSGREHRDARQESESIYREAGIPGPSGGDREASPVLKRVLASATILSLALVLTVCRDSDPVTSAPAKNLEWGNEAPVAITGYTGNAMEPKLSADDQVLFFNDKPAAGDSQMELHYATRVSATQYQYGGLLTGANINGFLDGVPAIDAASNLYFISLRSYASDQDTLYGGTYASGSVSGTARLGQQIVNTGAGELIMDIDVTPDGNFLILSRAVFTGGSVPAKADLDLAAKAGGVFVRVPAAAALLAAVNTREHLEYAATLSTDGLELYFTRAVDITQESGLRIMVAERPDASSNFGAPAEIAGISGTATEGPSLSADQKSLYFHKRSETGVFGIYRVTRP